MYQDRMQLFDAVPGAFGLYMALEEAITSHYPDVQIQERKTQIGFFAGCGFAFVSPPLRKRLGGVTLTLGLPDRLDSVCVLAATEPYPGRWTHHISITSAEEIDGELISWLDAAHSFALSRRRKKWSRC